MEINWNEMIDKAAMPVGADPADPPTVKQIRFLEDLSERRDAPESLVNEYFDTVDVGGMTKKKASYFIDSFLRYPKLSKRRARSTEIVEADSPVHREFREEVKEIPSARYAVPTADLMTEFLKTPVSGDLVFVEITERYGPKKMKRLSGSPGSFVRNDLHIDDALQILRVISRSPYDYTSMFATHYRVCGRCSAELTDPKSRELGLGPQCRKYFEHFMGIPLPVG